MALAWILISCSPGRERDVYLQLLEMESVSEVSVVYGELDLVARIDFDSEKEMSRTLICLLYTSPSPRDGLLSRMPSSA